MNQRNVEALKKAIWGTLAPGMLSANEITELARVLASRGCLGPASEVLPDPLCVPLPGGQVMEFYAPGINHALERIARGVA